MSMIGFEIEGLEEVRAKLKKLGSDAPRKEVTKDVATYLRAELQKYPSPRYVSRKQAYGRTFQSDKQRRWFFAALKSGELTIPYRRTQTLRRNWEIMPMGSSDYIVVNETPYAKWVQDEDTQSNMMRLRNWKTFQAVIQKAGDKIRQIANKVLDAYIRKIGL